jgi:hypothetical protein
LILGRLLVAVPTLALAGLTQHPLEEFVILKLVLDGLAMVGARFLLELLEVIVVSLSLDRLVGSCDCVGVREMPVPPLPLVLCYGGALFLLRTFGLSHGLATGEDCPDCLLAGGMVCGDVLEITSGEWLSTAELVNEGIAGGPNQECTNDV